MIIFATDNIIALLFSGLILIGCSHSDKGSTNGTPATDTSTTTTDTSITTTDTSTTSTGTSTTPTDTALPGEMPSGNNYHSGIEQSWTINASDPNKLYLGTDSAIIEVDKSTLGKRTIVGNTYDGVYSSARSALSYPSGIQLYGGNVYAGTLTGRVVRAYTGVDQFDAVDLYLPVMPGTINGLEYAAVTSNSTTLYYGGYEGIYAKSYDTADLPILLYPHSHFNAVATDDALYVVTYTLQGPQYYLVKYDLSSRQSTTIRSDLTPRPGGTGAEVFPMARSGADIYWVDGGSSIYRLDTNSGGIFLVTPVALSDVREIIVDDNYLYARMWNSVAKVTLATGATTTVSAGSVYSFAEEAGKIFYATGPILQINMIDESLQTTRLSAFDGQSFDAFSIYSVKLAASNGKLAVTTGGKAFIYDIASQSLDSIPAHTGYVSWVRNGKIYTGDRELFTIPIDKKIRPITEIYPSFTDIDPNSPSAVIATAIDSSSIYWITKGLYNGLNPFYRVSKAAHDGSSYQQLYEGSGELRDLSLHNGRLFFTCHDGCGEPGWVLASLPVAGGTPAPEFGLLGDPITYYKKGIFYVVDTYDLTKRSLYAVNIEESSYQELLSNLYYDNQVPRNVVIDVSSEWLYVAQYKMQMGGPPLAGLSRYPLISWNSIGAEEIIFNQNTADVNGFIFMTISTDDHYLYYWHDGLKRIAE